MKQCEMDSNQIIELQSKVMRALWDFDDKMRNAFPPEAFRRPQGFIFNWVGMEAVFERFLEDEYPEEFAELTAALKCFAGEEEP